MSVVAFKRSNKVNPDLANERKKCSFNTEEFTNWWYGGAKKVEEKRAREKYFLDDPELEDKVPLYFLSHKEIYEETVRKSAIAFQKIRKLQEEGNDGIDNYMALLGGMLGSAVTPHGNPVGVHFVMFLPTIMGQGTVEQQAEWMGKAWDLSIIGTYAQTELGHGTFIRGLETTATYDPKTQEFVLNSPTISSYKWWPGGLAHTANHCVVVAQLYTQGKGRGIFPFIVQLRDTETHMPLKGIKIGEIGAKLGMNSVNNGFLGFENVRIPRKNMLMKNAQVLEDGTFVKAPSSVLTYGTMVFVRVVIVRDMSLYLAKAATIAIRYSAVRRQSQINPSEPEVQVMDHLTQQHKLFPQLAKSIIFKLTADYIWEMYNQVTGELDKGQLDRLPEMHAMTCCLKAVTTADAAAGVETCRLACGGHGYMASSNFSISYGMVTAASTYEGENTVLLLQTARYLVKSWNAAITGQSLTPTVAYLGMVRRVKNPRFDRSLSGIIEAFQYSAGKMIEIAYNNIERRKKSMTNEEAVNATSIELACAAEMHCRAFLLESSYKAINASFGEFSPALGKVFKDIIELYSVDSALQNLKYLMRYVTITQEDVANLQDRLEMVLGRIRPNAVGLVDSFDISDKVLNSTLGAYDGNVYERLFEDALKSPLNQEPVNQSFQKYLKPLMMKSKM